MLIAAVSDIHYPRFKEIFEKALRNLKSGVEIFILAGDIINRGKWEYYTEVIKKIRKKACSRFIACFGNEEYDENKSKIIENNPEVKFLDDEYTIEKVGERKICFIGTRGSLDKPTPWQFRNIPNITEVYKDRIDKIYRIVKNLERKDDIIIFVSHYAPCYSTLEGEDKRIYPNLGSKRMEKIIKDSGVSMVIHGHSHHGKSFAWIDDKPVFNVALPLNKKITLIDIDNIPKKGLEKFW